MLTVWLAFLSQPYYTPNPPTDPYPRDPETYLNSVKSTIGAETDWAITNDTVYLNFAETGMFITQTMAEISDQVL